MSNDKTVWWTPFLFLTLTSCTPEQPVLSVLQPVHNWGTVVQGDKVTHAFFIRNEGNGTLEIDSVILPPGCEGLYVDKQIPPLGNGRIQVQLDTIPLEGPARKDIVVASNDPQSMKANLRLIGEVLPYVSFDPARVKIRTVPGESVTKSVTLTSVGQLGIERITSEARGKFILSAIEQVEPRKSYIVKIKNIEIDKLGMILDAVVLTITTSDGSQRYKEIPVLIEVADPVELVPRRAVVFRAFEIPLAGAHEFPTKSVMLSSTRERVTFAIKDVKISGPRGAFETKIVTIEEGTHYKIDIQLKRPPSRLVRADLIIVTDRDINASRRIRVIAICPDRR